MVDTSKYIKLFIDETRENIAKINDTVAIVEQNTSDSEALNTIFRAFHSIKGMAASMSFRNMQEVSHKLEDLLDAVRTEKIEWSEKIVNVLYDGTLILEKMVDVVEEGTDEKVDVASLWKMLEPFQASNTPVKSAVSIEPKEKTEQLSQKDLSALKKVGMSQYEIKVVISKESVSPPARAYLILESLKEKSSVEKCVPSIKEIEDGNIDREFEVYLSTEISQTDIELIIMSSTEVESVKVTPISVVKAEREDEPQKLVTRNPTPEKNQNNNRLFQYRKPGAVKVDTPVLDGFIDLVGEMFIQEYQLQDIIQSLGSPKAMDSVNGLVKLVQKFYKEVMKIRLVPISLLTEMIPRVMREVLRDQDKKVEMVVDGKEIKLDRSIVEKLGDPVIHIVRNCLDHGIETVDERVNSGKPETAKLVFSATSDKDFIIIKISDDGRGLNTEKIKEKVIKKGLASRETLEKSSLDEIHNYIWQPGFSTSEQVTTVSGRGVGMDIVKNVVEGLGGTVSVSSEPGKGSHFEIHVPMSMSIIRTFRIKLDEDLYAIPYGKVIRTIEVPIGDLVDNEEGLHFIYDEEKIFVSDLKSMLNYESNNEANRANIPILLVEADKKKIGLIVDVFLSGYETVVKSLGPPLEKLEIFSGATMSEKGDLILILDVDKLVKTVCEI